jgi:hypothetical protein
MKCNFFNEYLFITIINNNNNIHFYIYNKNVLFCRFKFESDDIQIIQDFDKIKMIII